MLLIPRKKPFQTGDLHHLREVALYQAYLLLKTFYLWARSTLIDDLVGLKLSFDKILRKFFDPGLEKGFMVYFLSQAFFFL